MESLIVNGFKAYVTE